MAMMLTLVSNLGNPFKIRLPRAFPLWEGYGIRGLSGQEYYENRLDYGDP